MNQLNNFLSHFKNQKEISRTDVFEYFYSQGMMKDNSIDSLIHRWNKKGILYTVKKGVYVLTDEKKKVFQLNVDKVQEKIVKIFTYEYPELPYCIWDTNILNQLMIHQHFDSFYIFETEADILESTFYYLKDNDFNVFLSPNEDITNKYVLNSENAVIIKKLVSRSPLEKRKKIIYPSLEKILVDIFVDKPIFQFIQGSELNNIYNEALNHYIVNFTKLLNYAERRNAKEDIINFIHVNVTNPDIIASI